MAYTISKKSWHFKLYSFYVRRISLRNRRVLPDSICLCPYMRTLLIWFPLTTSVWLSASVFAAFVVYEVIRAIIKLSTVAGWIAAAEVIGAIFLVIGSIVGVVYAGCVIKEKIDERSRSKQDEPQTIVGQHLKSLHEKICPCFEITD